ncbi:MAG TPA: hypothetical protein VHV81_13460 [Steroidobacteraceae bacterium]|nr:hypothetical protein [Steroidobacteraceae bacterium]
MRAVMAAALVVLAGPARAEVVNLTGMPLYPNLNSAVMDPWTRTDTLGHWCTRLTAESSDPVAKVEAWYRKTWLGSSETDLTHDKNYKSIPTLFGIKLAWGIDSVAVFKVSSTAPTSIQLSRCSR